MQKLTLLIVKFTKKTLTTAVENCIHIHNVKSTIWKYKQTTGIAKYWKAYKMVKTGVLKYSYITNKHKMLDIFSFKQLLWNRQTTLNYI